MPLTPAVVALLKEAQVRGLVHLPNPYVFKGGRGGNVSQRAVKAMGLLKTATAIDFDAHRHDLRRTAATLMAMSGLAREHIDRVLNHRRRGDAMSHVYDRYSYDSEKRIALETLARKVEAILSGGAAVVLPFSKGA